VKKDVEMRTTVTVAACLLAAGCGNPEAKTVQPKQEEPRTVEVAPTASSKTEESGPAAKPETEEEAAARKLAEWKAKWFDAEGNFSRDVSEISAAEVELGPVMKYLKTAPDVVKEAVRLDRMLKEAKIAGQRPTLQKPATNAAP
jgi:hypothetical protein